MTDPSDTMFTRLQSAMGRFGANVRDLGAAHLELARLETQAALASVRRLAVRLALAGVVAVTGLPVLVVFVADRLDGWVGIARSWWLLILGGTLIVAGVAYGAMAWRRFRQQFAGLEDTLTELREDVAWIREWVGTSGRTANDDP